MTITQVSRKLFENYLHILNKKFIEEENPHTLERILRLIAMCQTVTNHTSPYDNGLNEISEDKISRWLGYVQGIMTVYGWITVEQENETTRPLFLQAYEDLGLLTPNKSITAKLDPIIFHIVDMQGFNNKCVKKYGVRSYKELSKDKLLKVGFKIMRKHKPTVYKTLKKLNYTYEFNTISKPNLYSFIFHNIRLKG